MKALFKHGDGRLKTSRIALFVFLVLLVCLSFAYKMGKSADKVLVKIEHLFEAQKNESKKEPEAVVNKPLEDPVPRERSGIQPNEEQVSLKTGKEIGDGDRRKGGREDGDRGKGRWRPDQKAEKSVQRKDPKKKTGQEDESLAGKKSLPEVMAEDILNNVSTKNRAAEKALLNKPIRSEKDQAGLTLSRNVNVDLDKEVIKAGNENQAALNLPSKAYFEMYTQWKRQGETMDGKKTLVGLRILDLEKVYDLFQMKAVAVKEGEPHTDLEDNSRVARASLSEFSSTCFIVTSPWEKWGDALRSNGFREKDSIEVRYYTYEFVRNSIYARALKAFAWSVRQLNLPKDTDPSQADVLGRVYAINREGGGSFGVFVPLQVDFQSGESVKINPVLCFEGQKDIQVLNSAGLLMN